MYDWFDLFNFGKHEKTPVWIIAVCDPSYINWCINTIDSFSIDNFDGLRKLPLFCFDTESENYKKLIEATSIPVLFPGSVPNFQDCLNYLKDKNYSFYEASLRPLLSSYFAYSETAIALNEKRLSEIEPSHKTRMATQRNLGNSRDSNSSHEDRGYEKYNGAYGLNDETIDNAFEGDPENYWNID